MKTQEEKFSEFQKKLERYKKIAMWGIFCIIMITIGLGLCVSFFPSTLTIVSFICFIIFGGSGIFHPLIEKLNMELERTKTHNLRIKKKEDLRHFMEKYRDKDFYLLPKYEIVPEEFEHIAKHLLCCDTKKKPYEISNQVEEELSDDLIRMDVYSKSMERNWRQYFLSWKWFKKIK
jgi:hypothetical protein